MKINPDDFNKNEDIKFDFCLEYTTYENKKCSQSYSYTISNKKDKAETEYFKDNNIRKGLSIYYFANILNHIVETFNKGNYNNSKAKRYEKKKKEDLKLLETKKTIGEYLNKNFILDPNNNKAKNNLENYLKLIEERYKGFKEVVFQFYNLDAAPVNY